MFTGLIAATGTVKAVRRSEDGVRLEVETDLARELARGDSIAVNGVCLTAVDVDGDRFGADVVHETLARSSLGPLEADDEVNLELPLRVGDRLGGHFVQGHVDGLGTVESIGQEGFSRRVRIDAETDVSRYVVDKGSVTVDGVSLTAADAGGDGFAVALIPETLERTTLGNLAPGRRVNLEVDVLAKYVERLAPRTRAPAAEALP